MSNERSVQNLTLAEVAGAGGQAADCDAQSNFHGWNHILFLKSAPEGPARLSLVDAVWEGSPTDPRK